MGGIGSDDQLVDKLQGRAGQAGCDGEGVSGGIMLVMWGRAGQGRAGQGTQGMEVMYQGGNGGIKLVDRVKENSGFEETPARIQSQGCMKQRGLL